MGLGKPPGEQSLPEAYRDEDLPGTSSVASENQFMRPDLWGPSPVDAGL